MVETAAPTRRRRASTPMAPRPEAPLTAAPIRGRAGEFTRQDMIDAAWRFYQEHGVAPSARDWEPARLESAGEVERLARWRNGHYPTAHQVRHVFGRWSDVLYAAGLIPYCIQRKDYRRALITVRTNSKIIV